MGGVCSAAIHPRFHGHVHHIYRSAALHCSRAAVFADFAQVHYIVEKTMEFLRSGLACCILVMSLLATVEMTRADDPSAPWTTRALRQTASDYWTAPPSAVRVCVLDSAPIITAKVPNSIPPGTVLSSEKAKEVGPIAISIPVVSRDLHFHTCMLGYQPVVPVATKEYREPLSTTFDCVRVHPCLP